MDIVATRKILNNGIGTGKTLAFKLAHEYVDLLEAGDGTTLEVGEIMTSFTSLKEAYEKRGEVIEGLRDELATQIEASAIAIGELQNTISELTEAAESNASENQPDPASGD